MILRMSEHGNLAEMDISILDTIKGYHQVTFDCQTRLLRASARLKLNETYQTYFGTDRRQFSHLVSHNKGQFCISKGLDFTKNRKQFLYYRSYYLV